MICLLHDPLGHLPINAAVHGDHDDARDPETDRTGDDGVGLVYDEHARLRMLRDKVQVLLRGIPAEEDGREGDEGGQQPHVRQHEGHSPHRHVQGVFQGPNDGVVPAEEKRHSLFIDTGQRGATEDSSPVH